MKKTLTLGLSIAALAVAGTAVAQNAPAPNRGDWANKTMTRAEVQAQAGTMFDRMDATHDGKLDQADRAARKAEMLARLDTDKNGQLSPAELDAGRKNRPGRPEGAPDGDHAGMDHAGMAGMDHGKMGGHKMGGRGMGGGMGRMADANKDGTVTKAEFVAAALTRFDAGDTNRDGSLTPAERQAAHAAMKAKWQAGRPAKPAA
jgi:hypothetical protein